MMKSKSLMLSLCFVLVCGLSVPLAMADQWNQATKVHISAPMEVPGTVLPAGTYWFSLMSDDADRNIVQIWNAERTKLLSTTLTVPDYREHPTGKTVMKFSERPSRQPEALKAWFYPGDDYGHEFVYSETKAREIAKRTGEPVLSMRDDIAANMKKLAKSAKEASVTAMKQAHVQAVTPNGQEESAANVVQSKPNVAK